MKTTVGFIGLGLMGNPMAMNILKSNFSLSVFNRTLSKTDELQSSGAKVASSPRMLAFQVDVLITMVTGGNDVEAVLFGADGVVEGVHKDLVVIDMSTIGHVKAKEISRKLAEYGIGFLDAPVTGSTSKAFSGELTIFVGGDKAVLERCKPVLSAMGTNIVHMGPTGSGQAVKLANNFLTATFNEAMMEGMLLADGMGLPRQKVAEALINTPNIPDGIKKNLPEFV
ncbi:MAG: NAD(P)-dependent oxidoreductase, partial [Candidatus Micrarchaeaceae archaeon]